LAAIAPSDGLSFPADTCVYPLVAFQDFKRRSETQNDRLGVRQLTSGYMRSRSTTQFLTTEVTETEAGLVVKQTGRTLEAINQLGCTTTHVWIWDDEGQLFQAHDTVDGDHCQLEPTDAESAREELNKVMHANRPQAPPGLDKGIDRNMFGYLGRRAYGSSSPVKFRSGILEKSMRDTPSFFEQPIPRTYLAITEQAPVFVSTGTEAEEQAGFHVIWGASDKP